MLLKPLTLAAGLLAVPATRAFLIPPEVSDADIQVAETIESISAQVADSQVVNVECPGCPIRISGRHGGDIQLQVDRPTHLELSFSIDHQPDHDRLLVNGFELYPSGDPLADSLWARQIIDHRKEKKHYREHDGHDQEHRKRPGRFAPRPQRLGFAMLIAPPKIDAEAQLELIEVELQIFEVGAAFIDAIPSVKAKLVKDSEGRLLLTQIEKSKPKRLPGGSKDGAGECTTSMCKWLAAFREKLEKFKPFRPCHGGPMKGGMRPHGIGEGYRRPHHHHPHPRPGDHWRAPYQGRRWGKLFEYIATRILLPVLIGIVAGVSVSLIGMAVGTVIVSSWRFFRRRSSGHRRRHSRHHQRKATLKESAPVEEKSGLIEHQDPPPSYEEEETVKTSQV